MSLVFSGPGADGAQVRHEVRVLVGGRIGRRIRLAVAACVVRDGPDAGPPQEERKLVSAVIWNRLAKGMPLGIDATLRYGLGIQGTRPITAEEQKNQTPYNTGIRPGLPPTPIGNPGLPSMQAAAHPAASLRTPGIPSLPTHGAKP